VSITNDDTTKQDYCKENSYWSAIRTTQFVVVFGTSTSAFQLPSACLPHTTTYFAFNVCGFPFASGTVSE
jgi:hypothetical protein